MTAPTITVDSMRAKLYTLDQARTRLATTEPISTTPFQVGTDVAFRVGESWNANLESVKATDPVDATVRVNGVDMQLTKEALLEAAAITGLTKAYTGRAPSRLTQDALNFWYRAGLVGKDYQILAANGVASAITKSTLQPFSNLRLLDKVLEGIEDKYGVGEVLVDYKLNHTLNSTSLRLIVPESRRNMEDTGTPDDTWSMGVQLDNSLTGADQTQVSGYLFRWWCTNGATNTHSKGVWSRKSGGQGEEVYDWAKRSVDEILGGLESELDDVQATAYMDLSGDFAAMATDVFNRYKIPLAQRSIITERLIDEGNFTMYALMQAITASANDATMDPKHVSRLLRVGGDLPHVANNRCDLGQLHIID